MGEEVQESAQLQLRFHFDMDGHRDSILLRCHQTESRNRAHQWSNIELFEHYDNLSISGDGIARFLYTPST